MSYAPVHAATYGELAKLRSDGQGCRIKAVIIPQPVIFAAQVNGTPSSLDEVKSIVYDNVTTGTYTDIKAGMTLYLGSAAGLFDLGMARVKTSSATVITIGRTSDVSWADNLYISVVDDFGLWPKQPDLTADGVLIDDDVPYSDQHSDTDPVPVLGPDRVVTLSGDDVTVSPDGSNSWCADGSSITGYAWEITGGTVTNENTATPTLTFTVGGLKRLTLTVTASNGKSATGYRTIFVIDSNNQDNDQVVVDSLVGDGEEGGWSASLTVYATAGLADIRDRAKVILVADDVFGGETGSIGQISGAEHIVMIGWISGESIRYSRDQSTVSFTIFGPAHWLDVIGSAASMLENTASSPNDWTQIPNLTIDKALWHWLYWRCTLAEVCDLYPTGSTTRMGGVTGAMGSVWSQIKETIESRMAGFLRADRFGRVFAFIDPQVLPIASRSGIPVVQPITGDDLGGEVEITRQVKSEICILNLSGLSVDSAGQAGLVMSRAGGKAYKRFGRPETRDRMVVADQDHGNEISGMLMAKANNEFPMVGLTLEQSNRLVDIAPAMYLTLSIGSGDSARGVVWTDKKMLPKRVEITIDPENGAVTTLVECETETSGPPGVTVDAPQEPIYNFPDQPPMPDLNALGFLPTFSPITFPNLTIPEFVPQQIPVNPDSICPTDAPANGPYDLWIKGTFDTGDSPTGKLRCTLRSGSHDNKTTYTLHARFKKLVGGVYENTTDDGFYSIEAYDKSGTLIATGTKDAVNGANPNTRTGYFDLPAKAEVDYFALVVDPSKLIVPTYVNSVLSVSLGNIINNGQTVWWQNGKITGVHWWGVEIESKYSYDDMIISLYPKMGDSYLSAYYHIRGWQKWTCTGTKGDFVWRRYNGDLNHEQIGAGLTIDTNFQLSNHDNWMGIMVRSSENDGYFEPNFFYGTGECLWEVWPRADYRIEVESILLWNLCPPTTSEFGA